MTFVNEPSDSRTRRAGGWGLAFVVLLLIGAGMASVPGGDDSVSQVRSFYEQHTNAVFVSQVVELIASVTLALFLVGLAASGLVRARRDALLTGGAVVLASVLTLVPPMLLLLLHDRGSAGEVHVLAVLSDSTDVLLFVAIAGFAAVCGSSGPGPAWLRWLSLLVAVVSAVRAVEILLGGALLEVIAPLGFIVLVGALSVLLLRRGRQPASRPSGLSLSDAGNE